MPLFYRMLPRRAKSDRLLAYKFGQGVPQDYGKAVEWCRKAAMQGDLLGENVLGDAYDSGQGVPKNYASAAYWYRKAAMQGNPLAELLLGVMYDDGDGVPRNGAKALKWILRAAERGLAPAETQAGRAYYLGRGVPQDYAKAAEWFRKAAAQGDAPAEYNLGLAYGDGKGVPRDYVRAYKWVNLAAAQGNATVGHAILSVLSSRMTRAQIAEAQRLSAAFRPQVAGAPRAPEAPPAPKQPAGDLGSGFFVTQTGLVLTNAHVVDGCRQIFVDASPQPGNARLLARDPVNDLALLATGSHPPAVADLRLTVRQGDRIAVYGFPLPGLLAAAGNVTFGNVTALAGLGGNSGQMQISAPVQLGNSGGPVLDAHGNVVGVVVAKLNALGVAAATKDIPQSVNFAIKATTAAGFLQAQGVGFAHGTPGAPLPSAALAANARAFTVQVACTR